MTNRDTHLHTIENVTLLLTILKTGKENAMTSDKVQAALELPAQRTNEATRSLVSYAVREHGAPILSGPKGFWLAGNQQEVNEAISGLVQRMSAIMERITALNNIKL